MRTMAYHIKQAAAAISVAGMLAFTPALAQEGGNKDGGQKDYIAVAGFFDGVKASSKDRLPVRFYDHNGILFNSRTVTEDPNDSLKGQAHVDPLSIKSEYRLSASQSQSIFGEPHYTSLSCEFPNNLTRTMALFGYPRSLDPSNISQDVRDRGEIYCNKLLEILYSNIIRSVHK